MSFDKKAKTDLFGIKRLHHLEWYVFDASSASKVFKMGLGMNFIAESKKETGNHVYCSYVLETADVKFVVTAPYLAQFRHPDNVQPDPHYDEKRATHFVQRHGNGVYAIGVEVDDATEAFKIATQNGATAMMEPTEIKNPEGGRVVMSEILIYHENDSTDPTHKSETVLRFLQVDGFSGAFLPGYRPVTDKVPKDYGILRMDHVVGNVFDLERVIGDIKKWTGMHTFAKFTKEDIKTAWTSLNSEVLANNNLRVLLPVNETAEGKKESQILEYLKAYNGPGVQHIALKSSNVFATVELIASNSHMGFEFIPTPPAYYEDPVIVKRMEEHLEKEEREAVKRLGILVDLDEEGVLLQIFTKPLFDRPTVFVEIIQRKCIGQTIDVPGCGGFGKGNFKALFESIERLQKERGGLLESDSKK